MAGIAVDMSSKGLPTRLAVYLTPIKTRPHQQSKLDVFIQQE
jgi:hypothetical protein